MLSVMNHDNICNMDQTIFFYFYLRKFNCWIGFPLILFMLWKKEKKDEKNIGYIFSGNTDCILHTKDASNARCGRSQFCTGNGLNGSMKRSTSALFLCGFRQSTERFRTKIPSRSVTVFYNISKRC